MKNFFLPLILSVIITGILTSCLEEIDKYERPHWMIGKLYSQIESTEDLDSFAVCIKQSGLDTIIDISGSFTVFAPTNEAFRVFLGQSPAYDKISDIPRKELERIVKYHIVQNSWTIAQLKSLDIYGWIDQSDPANNKPWGYKRQTILRDENRKYWVTSDRGRFYISDSLNASTSRLVVNDSRKYAPLFFDDFLSIAQLTDEDYNFYFDQGYSRGRIHFAGARIIDSEIYADNGILYKIDGVVLPLKSAEEHLSQNYQGHAYSDFLSMIYSYGELSENMAETMKLPGFAQGLEVDTLYNLDYPELTFNIGSELSNPPGTSSTFSIRFNNGIVAPTNEALEKLFSEVITGPNRWPNRDAVPSIINQIIINSHMSSSPIYQSHFSRGFVNGEEDLVFLDQSSIIQTDYASNSSFIGVDNAIVPRAFSSVAGPVYLRPGYSIYRRAMEFTNVLSAIKKKEDEFSFFIVPDITLLADSSLIFRPHPTNPNIIQLISYDRPDERFVNRNRSDILFQILNHVGTRKPTGVPRREFIPNLAGNYIVFDWENDLVSGGVNSSFGYNGDSVIYLTPLLMDDPIDNGITYSINGWFDFPQNNIFSIVNNYSGFADLLRRADALDNIRATLKFLSAGEYYTIFIPSDEALLNYDTSSLNQEELLQFIKYHFVAGDIIFTDGDKTHSHYPTLRVDETSSAYNRRFSELNIRPGVDVIDILNPDGSLYYRIDEKPGLSNIMTADYIGNYITTGVVHVIDTVLVK
jgi:uncharacterized surface protein with fasciclin (FAS1) repeats